MMIYCNKGCVNVGTLSLITSTAAVTNSGVSTPTARGQQKGDSVMGGVGRDVARLHMLLRRACRLK